MGFFAQNIGLRGDFRYFRCFQGSSDNVDRPRAEQLQLLAQSVGSDVQILETSHGSGLRAAHGSGRLRLHD